MVLMHGAGGIMMHIFCPEAQHVLLQRVHDVLLEADLCAFSDCFKSGALSRRHSVFCALQAPIQAWLLGFVCI
jgi:hypothetical protein